MSSVWMEQDNGAASHPFRLAIRQRAFWIGRLPEDMAMRGAEDWVIERHREVHLRRPRQPVVDRPSGPLKLSGVSELLRGPHGRPTWSFPRLRGRVWASRYDAAVAARLAWLIPRAD